jgi:putative DNA primase/helicase
MRGLLNAGHSRSGQVIRTVGEDFEPRAFKVWGSVVIAGIGRMPTTIEDRSITIPLRRRLPKEQIERLRTNRTGHLAELGRRAARWVADHKIALADADPVLPDSLGDRERDNWRPLVVIADTISKELGQRIRDAAVAIASEEVDEENKSIMALADVAAIFETKQIDKISSQELVFALVGMDERPWGEWRHGAPITKNSLARLLKPFNIRPKPIRFEPNPKPTRSGYLVGPIMEAKNRYVDHEIKTTEAGGVDEGDPSSQPIPEIKPKLRNQAMKPSTSAKSIRNSGFGLKRRKRQR